MIELKNLSKRYGSRNVLENISLVLEDSQTHVLIGSSGSGKSTLLRLIVGLASPDGGEVAIDSKSLASIPRSELGRIFGFVLQKPALFPHLSARENILIPARTHNIPVTDLKKRLEYLTELLHLENYLLDQYPFQLSGGQQQRMSVLRALLLDPPYLLLDESLSALDPIIRSDLQENLKQIFSKLRKTVVFVTHDLREAQYLADKIYLLNEGKIEQSGSFESLKESPKSEFVKKFVNSQIRI